METSSSAQNISKLEEGKGFRKSTRLHARYQTWSTL